MDVTQGSSVEEENEVQSNTSWIPITPGKPCVAGTETGAQNAAACCGSTSSVTVDECSATSEVYGGGGGRKMYNDLPRANVDMWSNVVSFKDLLALAHAGGTTSAAEIVNHGAAYSVKSSFKPLFGSQNADGSSIFPSFPFQFEPVTPDLTKSKGKASNASSLDNILTTVTTVSSIQSNEGPTKRAEADEVEQNKEKSELVLGQSELQENKPENNISPQKPRRRKHRPKVVIEGKQKRTRKPRTEKQPGSGETKTEKRKYVRKNKVHTSAEGVNTTICQEGSPPSSKETPAEGTSPSSKETPTEGTSPSSKETPTGGATPSSKETPTTKRKYVRRNPVNKNTEKPSEERIIEIIDLTKETPTTKRKYVRRRVNKSTEKPSEEGNSGITDPTKVSVPRKPCRRSLKFELESQASAENSSFGPSSTTSDFHVSRTGSTTQSAQLRQGIEAATEETKVGATCDITSSLNQETRNYVPHSEMRYPGPRTTDKVFRNHDKVMRGYQNEGTSGTCVIDFSDLTQASVQQMPPKRSECSNFRSAACLHCEKGLKRPYSCRTNEAQFVNTRGVYFNSIQAYRAILPANGPDTYGNLGIHFPAIYKKTRIEMGHTSATFSSKPFTSETNHPSSSSGSPSHNSAIHIAANRMQNSGFTSASPEAEIKLRKRKSNKQSRTSILVSSTASEGILVSSMASEGILVSSTASDMYTDQQFKMKKRGRPPAIKWGDMSPIDDIAERLKHLDLNRESSALVLYQRDGTMVPFVRRRKPRPRVDVDDETERVWKLLLQDINSEGIDGTDEDKAKWWEEERKVFSSRADSFIARMRLVQGDRRFSPWKGSVLDSVVGVFLTQNVSDHLSSSAFMSLAAQYPLKSSSSSQNLERRTDSIIEEPEECAMDPNVTIRWHEDQINESACCQDSSNEEKATVNSSESSETSTHCMKSDSSREDSDLYQESTVNSSADQRESNDLPSSPSSVVSSENSAVIQVSERTDSSNTGGSTSFLKLLQMAETSEVVVDVAKTANIVVDSHKSEQGPTELNLKNDGDHVCNKVDSVNANPSKAKKGQPDKEKEKIDWDSLRVQAEAKGKRERTENTMDSVDWEALRSAPVEEVAHTIRERGMNNRLAERIKACLDRLASDHGSIDLEWLRDVPPDKAKEYLLSIKGLGLKSVECIRLLTLHHLAFPVDTNVGRIAVRLGWVPLQPLPESLQLHLLEMYPIQESIQKFLWPRLCKLDQKTLYELHYHMITFGKVFCTKSKPNCNACPMRGECRHFASAFASARFALPAPEEKSIVGATVNGAANDNPRQNVTPMPLPLPPGNEQTVEHPKLISSAPIIEEPATPEPIVEVPATPEQEQIQVPETDIEDAYFGDPNEIPIIELNMAEFTQNVKKYVENNMVLHQVEVSNALVALTSEAASIPTPKLKNYSRLRTEHQVYELPDSHPLLEGLDRREPDDPCSYLLAIWTPGETANSMQPPERKCDSQESGTLCDNETCSSCNSIREANSQTVRGTLLIPCRTAMRGSFPLNGTYFQVNEVFADHDSSLKPINVPRDWLWNLPRRTVYFGTSIPTIFKGLTTESIQHCFWRGFVCVRGFDQKTRAPKPLMARLHFPASRLTKPNGKTDEVNGAAK